MLAELKQLVVEANKELARAGLVIYTWGNASGILRMRAWGNQAQRRSL